MLKVACYSSLYQLLVISYIPNRLIPIILQNLLQKEKLFTIRTISLNILPNYYKISNYFNTLVYLINHLPNIPSSLTNCSAYQESGAPGAS